MTTTAAGAHRPSPDDYPHQYSSTFRLRDGVEVVIRAIRPEDEPLLVAFHAGHSERTIRMRFFGMVKALTHDDLVKLCRLDYSRAMALVAEVRDGNGRPHLAGVARYYLNADTGTAEFAIVVGDAWQGRGLGRELLRRLIEAARERGVGRLAGEVLSENVPMLHLTAGFGFRIRPTKQHGVIALVLPLETP